MVVDSLRDRLSAYPEDVRLLAMKAVQLCRYNSKASAVEQLAAEIRACTPTPDQERTGDDT